MFRESIHDLIARALICALFALVTVNLLADFMRTGHVTGLLLLVSEALIVVLTVIRRRARMIDRSTAAAVATTLSLVGPPLLRAGETAALLPDTVTAVLSAFGLLLVIGGKMTLGRSFGIAPANRGVVARGPYLFVRHPIYAGYLITHVAFLIAQPTMQNMVIVAVSDSALIVRALIEERVLSLDAEYQSYCQRVSWHLVPGVF
jgi:protein-S-isoprenylcysteine O-methyltransferase Ste14